MSENSEEEKGINGYFEDSQNEVRFIPRTYLLRKTEQLVTEVAIGKLPFCDLNILTQKFPTLLPDVAAAKDFVKTQCHGKHGSPYVFHFISHYGIGDISLNNTASKCLEKLGSDRFVNTKVIARCMSFF